jgi:hypothetical protein
MRSMIRLTGLVLIVAACSGACHSGKPPPGQVVSDNILPIGDPTTSWMEPELLPGGTGSWYCGGFADMDGDGSPEVIAVGIYSARLYKRVDATWETHDVALAPAGSQSMSSVLGCEAVDVDNDGDLDLIVVNGSGGFVAVNDGAWSFHVLPLPEFPAAGNANAWAVAAFDGDGDAYPELYVARTVAGGANAFIKDGCVCQDDGTIRCGRDGKQYPGSPNLLLHNVGGKGFEIVANSGAEDGNQSQALAVYDFDGDGKQDLLVGDDGTNNALYLNRGKLNFESGTDALGLTARNHGMGFGYGDLDGDGHDDLAVSEIGAPWILLGQGAGHPFTTLPHDHGLGRVAQWGWGVEMEDFDNDGALDLLFFNQAITGIQYVTFCADHPAEHVTQSQLLLYRNDGHAHFKAETGVKADSPLASIGGAYTGGQTLAASDVDDDGVLDGFILHWTDDQGDVTEPWLLHGRLSSPANSLTVAAPQGAIVTVCTPAQCLHREVGGVHSVAAIHPREVHFGLGSATSADVTVEFPRGAKHSLGSVAAGQRKVWTP